MICIKCSRNCIEGIDRNGVVRYYCYSCDKIYSLKKKKGGSKKDGDKNNKHKC